MKDEASFEYIGSTLDDAIGECFDKVARILDMPYPGGPNIERIASLGKDTYPMPKILDDDSLEMFMKLLFDPLPDMGWKMEAKDENGKCYRKITYCPKCEMAKKLGAEKLMYLLACCTDHYSSKGFNEDIVFERTTTLMQGGSCCDFCFYMKNKDNK